MSDPGRRSTLPSFWPVLLRLLGSVALVTSVMSVVSVVTVAGTGPATAAGPGRPNVVLVVTDDMRASDLRWMPLTRRLIGGEGATFPNALSAHPLCCPARAALLTGQYAQNNGVVSNTPRHSFRKFQAGTALPVWLARAGYRTAFTGKFMNGYPAARAPRLPGWTYWDPTMRGAYDYEDYQTHADGRPRWHRDGRLNQTDYTVRRTLDLIRRFSARPEPFFVYASHLAPHGERPLGGGHARHQPVPPQRYRARFAGVVSPSLSDPGRRDDVRDNVRAIRRADPVPRARVNSVFRSRIQSLQAVDRGVQQIIGTLRARGELANTYVVFTSDNGFTLGEHRTMTKNLPFDQSVTVPFLVRGPGIPRGVVRPGFVELIDVAPTIAAVARARPLVRVDGTSFLPAARSGRGLRRTVLIQAGAERHQRPGPDGYLWRGVLTPRWTYARWGAEGFTELYDDRADPAQNVNLADDRRYAGVVAELGRRTLVLGRCRGVAQCSRDFGPDPRPPGTPS